MVRGWFGSEHFKRILNGKVLNKDQASAALHSIMSSDHTQDDVVKFLQALNIREVTIAEVAGFVEAMRAAVVQVAARGLFRPGIVMVGTGGDKSGTFNISTTAALVIAGTDRVIVAKHGNRAASSKCGSADVLEALGVNINVSSGTVRHCLREAGMGFMFAPAFHPAMKEVALARKALGVRTIFNFLGPLANPAGVTRQVIGVSDEIMAEKLAEVLSEVNTEHALVVNGPADLDEIGLSGPTTVHEVRDGSLTTYEIRPEDFGLDPASLDEIRGGDTKTNATIILQLLSSQLHGSKRDMVLLNAAAGLYVADVVPSIQDGLVVARRSIDSGQAMTALKKLQMTSQEG